MTENKRKRRVGIVGFGNLALDGGKDTDGNIKAQLLLLVTCICRTSQQTPTAFQALHRLVLVFDQTDIDPILQQIKVKKNPGQYLYEAVKAHDEYEIAFVWNRTVDNLKGKIPANFVLEDLGKFASRNPDLIVEVAHPSISVQYGQLFLEKADYMVGSPTALADQQVEDSLRKAANIHGLYIPAGALWGGSDIQKMADRGTLKGLKITMTKHPDHFRLSSPLKEKNASVTDKAVTLYEGSVRGLCPLAPHNVNTMAAGAIAAHSLGFDRVQGSLVADPSLQEWHYVEVEVTGPGDKEAGKAFTVNTLRKNPAKPGAVTGSATSASFLSSLIRAHDMGPGVHLC